MPSSPRPAPMRIVATMAIALVVAGLAVMLGFWQHGRHVDRADAVAAFEAAAGLDPAPLSDVVASTSEALPAGAEWRTITATGRVDPASLTVLRTRPVDGTPAWQYLAWLETGDGRSLLVGLGWIPQPGPTADPAVPELDGAETVTVTAVLRAWEEDDGKGAGESITRIAPAQLPTPPSDPVGGYGMLREWCDADGCTDTPVGDPVPLPQLSVGPHLAYAWQWWLFAALAPVGGVLLLRRDALMAAEQQGDAPTQPPRAAERPSGRRRHDGSVGRRRRRGLSDEEIEDALQDGPVTPGR